MAENPSRWLTFGGGINERDDFNISLDECISGQNFDLNVNKKSLVPRAPFDLKGTAPNAGTITGIMQHIKRDNSQTQLVVAGNVLYDWDGTSGWTTVVSVTGSKMRGTGWLLDDLLITTDLGHNNVVGEWNGSTYSVLTHSISGVTDLYAKYAIQHQGRLWLFNVKADTTTTEHMILASDFEATTFDNSVTPDATALTYSDAFYLLAPDLKPINGAAAFFGTIVVSTIEGRLFQITGTDATNYAIREWYPGSAAMGVENIVNVGNDIQYVKEGKIIESLRSTDAYGDVSADDLSRWIPDTMTTGDFSASIMVYDQQKQRVYTFTALEDNANEGICIVYDKHIADTGGGISPWMKWATLMDNRLITQAASYLKVPASNARKVYWGDASGNVYQMEGSGSGDGGASAIPVNRTSRFLAELGATDDIVAGRAEYRRDTAASITLSMDWADSRHTETVTLLLKEVESIGTANYWGGNVWWGGEAYWGGGTKPARGRQVSRVGFSIPGRSDSGGFLQVSAADVDSWELSRIGI